jgi:hypothetical protein
MVPLNELRQRFSGDTNVVFIAVNVGSIDSRSVYESAISQVPYKYFVNMYDSAGLFASHLGLQSCPEELIVKKTKLSGHIQVGFGMI